MSEIDIILKVIAILDRNVKSRERYASELANFKGRKIQAETNQYRLGVLGVTSCGKSTMINSLLGDSILPAFARPSTSQLVSCHHLNMKCARIYFENGTCKEFRGSDVNKDLLSRFGDEGSNCRNKECVKQIELATPEFPFEDNLILIDSPGLDAYGYEGHEQLTMNSLLPTLDICVFVTTCKTNSDEKMLSVLNTIADYDKPLVIVQNMIDSLKPSLDGKKTIVDVAQEHRRRIERIVQKSTIKDKSKVHIVQISAVNALKARQNRLRSQLDIDLLEKSNYKHLVEVIKNTLHQLIPTINGHRLRFLKKEILRIAKAALEDGSNSSATMEKFEYAGLTDEYEKIRVECFKILNDKIQGLHTLLRNTSDMYFFNQKVINDINRNLRDCEYSICDEMRHLNSSIIDICHRLNIDSRDIVCDFSFNRPQATVSNKVVVVQEGYWEKGRRHWYSLWLKKDPDKYIEPIVKSETDMKQTREIAIKSISGAITIFDKTIKRWKTSIHNTEGRLYTVIDNRYNEYKARREKFLDAQSYLQIGKDLQEVANGIKEIREEASSVQNTKTEVKDSVRFDINVNSSLVSIYELANKVRNRIQQDAFKFFLPSSSKDIIIGWDMDCEQKILLYGFSLNLPIERIKEGVNNLRSSLVLVHKPSQQLPFTQPAKNVFVLLNATQFGAALSELAKLRLTNIMNKSDRLYFVVQDFNEIINGDSVSETLDNISKINKYRGIEVISTIRVLLLHDNPIYNLVAIEAQTTGCTQQYDEIRILNDVQRRFHFLLPQEKVSRNAALNTLKVITQKIGKL
ncbi:MAG: dynamin family protein [Parabacteroides sp.]